MFAKSLLGLIVTLTFATAVRAAPPSDRNAALIYWQAFAEFPTLSKDEEELLGNWRTAAPDAKAKAVADKFEPALKGLHRAAAASRCDWELPTEDGFFVLLPHISKARQLSRAAGLRARVRLAAGDAAGAAEDIGDTFVLARRAGGDGFLVCVLVQYAMEAQMIDLAAEHLSALRATPLIARLDKLPAAKTIGECLLTEQKIVLDTLVAQLQTALKDGGPAGFKAKFRELAALVNGGPGPAPLDLADKPDEAIRLFLEATDLYRQMSDWTKLPYDEGSAKFEEMKKNVLPKNPFAMLLTPAIDKCRAAELMSQTRMALLKAAAAVLSDGPDALSKHSDPYGGAPFAHAKTADGFVLTAKMKGNDGKPISLTVGKPAAK